MLSAITLNASLVRRAKAELARDSTLANLFARVGPFRLKPDRKREPFEALLRAAGLSWAKVDALHDLAQKRQQNLVPTRRQADAMSDAELIERLTAVRGVGRWTVEMLLIFTLGRADVLPVADLGIRRGYQLAFGKRREPEQKQLQKIGRAWAPYRSVVSWCLWRANDLDWSKQ